MAQEGTMGVVIRAIRASTNYCVKSAGRHLESVGRDSLWMVYSVHRVF